MSKRKFFYDTLVDSSSRLQGCVVQCKGEPVLINNVCGLNTDQMAEVSYLPLSRLEKSEVVPLTRDYFEVNNLPTLGYVDYKNYSYYLSRKPIRAVKQGLDRRNVQVPGNPEGFTPNFDTLLNRKEFCDMLKGKYEPFKSVFERLLSSDDPCQKSFSKTFCLSFDDMESVTLVNRGIKVAVINNPRKFGPVFHLPKKFSYLREELEEEGIKVG